MYQELIEYFSSRKNLANAWDVSRSVVSKWLTTYSIPAQRLIEIEIITNGKFKAKDLYEYQQSQSQSAGKNKYRLPTDEEIEKAIARFDIAAGAELPDYSRDVFKHPARVRAAFAFLDAQTKTKQCQGFAGHLKHCAERWAGLHITRYDLAVAAMLHPDVYGEYPDYNISRSVVFPCHRRLEGLPQAFKDAYEPDMSDYARIECSDDTNKKR